MIMTARMRRNAESLLLLAGLEPHRQWSAPIKLIDVLRGALGEVEDYNRVEITRLDDATLANIQTMANETIEEVACENPLSAKVYASMVSYLQDYAQWRDASAPFNLGRTPKGPDLAKLEECAKT